MKETNASLIMIRDNLDQIPAYALPPGNYLRAYQAGDEETWVTIQSAADVYNEITLDLFVREFGQDHALLAARQLYLCTSDHRPIGTAAAWFDDNYEGQKFGLVHWVAILPEHQGLGLAKPLMTAVCQRLRKLGHDRAYLTTSTARIPAINLYLKFGFRPVEENDVESTKWQAPIKR